MSARVRTVGTTPSYPVHLGPGAIAGLPALLEQVAPGRTRRALIDARFAELHGPNLPAALMDEAIVLPPGEEAKSWERLGLVLELLAEAALDRRCVLVALGGGATGDLTGLAASLYLRGVDFVQVPTTLLSQVDASVGGKTAVNLSAGKNLVGTFHQPLAVVADTTLLGTLTDDEFASGLGEVLKAGLLGAEGVLETLEQRTDAVLARDPEVLANLVDACVAHKAAVVAADEREAGARAQLNLGHTFAHAYETELGHGVVAHGRAVALGLLQALELSRRHGLLADDALIARTRALSERLGLPLSPADLQAKDLDPDRLIGRMTHDKKSVAGDPRFVLLEDLGRPRWGVAVSRDLVLEVLA
jgi:3-dehydroquinate synthase